MSAASTETSAPPLPSAAGRVFFQAAPGVGCAGSAAAAAAVAAAAALGGGGGGGGPDDPVQKRQGKVTVKYDRKELRKRLVLEEWIIEQLSELYDCEEEEMPEVEIDIDDLLEVDGDDERAVKLQESLIDCYKPTEDFVRELLGRIRGMRKLSAPSKKGL
ncbi:protein phosphatase 1 regulatory subunit 14C [Corythoichthys intestinalis]|uniref:protein phosphatase 1 regulatory subunit 14C n=1 Tax=Corythoichthys intestinalis TaxID=161448 RepID=UPI0025A5B72E|nr:protein phosphatase 1 regulatory subunit 14C [Corythoichthys intestinalis]XP_061806238.1 protein phosphatase 1 regulatory subunit 14C-like [Nerophis lumbriciformis]